jgi:hypothetical protein
MGVSWICRSRGPVSQQRKRRSQGHGERTRLGERVSLRSRIVPSSFFLEFVVAQTERPGESDTEVRVQQLALGLGVMRERRARGTRGRRRADISRSVLVVEREDRRQLMGRVGALRCRRPTSLGTWWKGRSYGSAVSESPKARRTSTGDRLTPRMLHSAALLVCS